MRYLVILPRAWGAGDTVDKARAVARKAGGYGRKKVNARIVFAFDPAKTPKAYVSLEGALCWEGDRPEEIERIEEP